MKITMFHNIDSFPMITMPYNQLKYYLLTQDKFDIERECNLLIFSSLLTLHIFFVSLHPLYAKKNYLLITIKENYTMGRAFEYRKARKLKRWGNMARTFTRIGKEIEIAVKAGGPDPDNNIRLRLLMQTAKTENMPKDNVERAIKRATSKDTSDYKEVTYDGKGPHGVVVVVETLTNNTTRTSANLRAAFVRGKGELGTTGMNDFMFERKCSFVVAWNESIDMDELELELIDCDIDEVFRDEDEIMIYADFKNYGAIQKYLDEHKLEIKSFKFERIPVTMRELSPEEQEDVNGLIERLENDEDVVNVFHNMA